MGQSAKRSIDLNKLLPYTNSLVVKNLSRSLQKKILHRKEKTTTTKKRLAFWNFKLPSLFPCQKHCCLSDMCFPSGGSVSFWLDIGVLCCYCTSGPLWPTMCVFQFPKTLLNIFRETHIQNWETSESPFPHLLLPFWPFY